MKIFKTQLQLIRQNDMSIHTWLEALLHPSLRIMLFYRLSHFFYQHKCYFLARLIANYNKKVTGAEIHPGATLADDVFIDHGLGVVIGETAIVGHRVVIYHGVTLGARKPMIGRRHPLVLDDVFIGAGAKVLGNIVIHSHVKIGANAVVLDDVPSNSTVVGVPAKKR